LGPESGALVVDYASFVTAINSIVNWATVSCDATNLLYDGNTFAKNVLLGSVDCGILDG